jgi:hypothetical protein
LVSLRLIDGKRTHELVAGDEVAPPIKIDISAIPKFRVPA